MDVRSVGSLIACLLVASPEAKAQSSQKDATHPSELRDSAETYAVYSAILAHPPTRLITD
jgi:hypothetical protein